MILLNVLDDDMRFLKDKFDGFSSKNNIQKAASI
jgi:hypothetical protein